MRKNKTIHIVVKYFLPVTAGIEVNIVETYSRLVERGWDVTVHTSADTYQEKNILPKHEVIRGIKITRYPFRWYGFFPKIDLRKTDIVALHNFDIFPHLHLFIRYLAMKLVGRKNFAVALTPHGGFTPEWRMFSKVQKIIKKTYHETLGLFLIKKVVDGVRAVSDWEKKELISLGIEKSLIKTISNGLEDEAYENIDKNASALVKSKVRSYGKYIFGNARIYEIKNQETIIRALPYLPKDINFVNIGTVGSTVGNQIGSDTYLRYLKTLASELGVSHRVIFPGVIKGSDKYFMFKHAICFVHMAIWESFCNVVHEAISQGQICIVANNTALPYLVNNDINGFLVDTKDAKALAARINFILNSKNRLQVKKIRAYNSSHGKDNSWRNVAEKMEVFYASL